MTPEEFAILVKRSFFPVAVYSIGAERFGPQTRATIDIRITATSGRHLRITQRIEPIVNAMRI
jgi:hypothetical protein